MTGSCPMKMHPQVTPNAAGYQSIIIVPLQVRLTIMIFFPLALRTASQLLQTRPQVLQ